MIRTTSTLRSRKQLSKRYIKNNLEEIILRMSVEGSVHGYGLISYFKDALGILFSPSEIYPDLWKLKKEGYLTPKKERSSNGKERIAYYPVISKTIERLKEIRDVKNQNRRKINNLSSKVFSVQFSELPMEV